MSDKANEPVSADALAPISFTFNPAKLIETMWPNVPYNGDPDEEQPEPFAGPREVIQRIVAERLHKELAQEIRQFISQELRDSVQKQVEIILREVIAKPIVPTDRFGSRIGDETSLNAMIVDQAQKTLKSRVNSRGEIDRYSSSDSRPWINHVVASEVQSAIKKELSEAVAAATVQAQEQLKEAVKETFAEQVAKTVTRNLR